MNHLTTDSYTAAKMMEALEAFKGSMPEVKKWYRDLTEILFQDDPIDAGGGKTYRVAQSTTSRRRTETPVASTKGGQPDEDGNASVPASKIGPMEELRISPSLRVFMCHASDDKPAVRELYERLKRASIDPWLDAEDILAGQAWRYEIEKAVRSTHIVLVCLSKRSASKTGFVNREIRIALDVADQQPEGTIFVIPLKLEECDVPDRLRQWQWVNLYEEKGFEKLMRALLERARSVGIRLEQYTPP
jgi:hypothetical protein